MAKKNDEKIEKPEEKDIESDEEVEASEGAEVPTESIGKEEEKKSLFEDEPEEVEEAGPKKKSVADIVKGNSSDSSEEDEDGLEDEEDALEEEPEEADKDDEIEEDLEDEEDEEAKVTTEEEIEEKADEDFQAGIPSEKKKAKKTKKKKGVLKKLFLITLIIFVLLLGAFVGVQIYNSLNKKEAPKEEVKVEAPSQEEAKPVEEKIVYVTAEDGLNLREEGSDAGKLIVTMPYGTKLTVLDEDGDWYQVDYNGQEGWCAKLYTSEEKPAAAWKTYTGSGFMATAPKFSIKYPADWTLTEGYRIRKTDDGKKYMIALGEGGHGMTEGPGTGITTSSKKVTYNGLPATQTIAKKNGEIFFIVVQFKKGNDTTQVEMNLPAGYDESYIETFDQMLETFKYL